VISAFDLVALQEVDRQLDQLEALLDILADWSSLVTDVAPGAWGNNERFAILYYQPRVEFRHFSSNLVMPPERRRRGASAGRTVGAPAAAGGLWLRRLGIPGLHHPHRLGWQCPGR
jgi:hypothetical protein